MAATSTPFRYALSPDAGTLVASLAVDQEMFPDVDIVTAVTALWAHRALTGPAYPDVYATTEYQLVAAAELADGTTVMSSSNDFTALTGALATERTPADVVRAVRALIGALNVALDAHDAYVAVRLDDLTFLEIAAAFEDPEAAGLEYQLVAPRVAVDATTLLALLESVDELCLESDADEDMFIDGPVVVFDPDAAPPTTAQLVAYVASLEDEPDEDGYALLYAGATAAGITRGLLEEFEAEADDSPALALETIGFLLTVATTMGLCTTNELVVVFDQSGSGRTFRVGGTIMSSGARTSLLSGPLPTTLLTGPSAPTVPWRLMHGVETVVAGLNGALSAHSEALSVAFTVAVVESEAA